MNKKSTLILLVFILYCAAVAAVLLVGGCLRDQSIGERLKPAVAPNFKAIEQSSERKQAFFDFFKPLVKEENTLLRLYRARIENILNSLGQGIEIHGRDKIFIESMVNKYDIDHEQPLTAQLQDLMLRVDELPVALVLVQAAVESGWGTSRFALKGNNYFGQWCFSEGCGLVPNSRLPGKVHEVAVFRDPRHSLKAYMLNINRFGAYEAFRKKRAALRRDGAPLSALALVGTLSHYSERGQAYIEQVKKMIRVNGLE